MKHLLFAAALAFGLQAFAHGGSHPDAHLVFPTNGVHAHLFWENGPNDGTESILRVEFMKAVDHSPADVTADLEVELWMPDMGHGSAPTAVQRVVDDRGQVRAGVFRVSNVYFLMPGLWDVRVSLKGTGAVETKAFQVTVGGNGGGHGGHQH